MAAVDLTPRTLDIAVSDICGEIVAEHRYRPVEEADLDVEGLCRAVSVAAAEVGLTTAQLHRVVVGVPGSVDARTGHLGFAPHLPPWQGFHVLARLSGSLATSVAVENDVNLVALDEMAVGQAVGVDDFVLIWMGRGVASRWSRAGVCCGARPVRAGEIDWMPCPPSGVTGGRRIGDVLGIKAVMELAHAHGLAGDDLEKLLAADLGSDPVARSAFLRDLARRVALAVAGVVSVVDPALVVLTGDVGAAGGSVLCGLVTEELGELVLPRPKIQPSLLTGNPVRSGALRLALAAAREEVFTVIPTP